jgi:hypothetical protein
VIDLLAMLLILGCLSLWTVILVLLAGLLYAMTNLFPRKEIGWEEIGEKFTRFSLLKTPWLNIYLHKLDAPSWHPECHDHPWNFVAFLIWNGYLERIGDIDYRRRPGTFLYRPAEFAHNVITPYGTSWSIIFTTSKKREWGFKACQLEG